MIREVDVLVATAGKVRAIRDGVPDRPITDQNCSSLAGKECDNAVALRHEDCWETRYCHLKNGSIRKRAGDIVQPGDVLSQVGMSGLSNFAHLHLSVSRDGHIVDPFVPEHRNRLFATCAKRIVARSVHL